MLQCRKISTPAVAFVIAMFAVIPSAMAQTGSGMSEQLARMGGSMSVVSKACGGSSDQEQTASKEKQKAMLAQRGVDAAAFDKAYAAGADDARRKWGSMSPGKHAETCENIKQRMSAAAQQVGK